jgi:hypothetical protein
VLIVAHDGSAFSLAALMGVVDPLKLLIADEKRGKKNERELRRKVGALRVEIYSPH